MSGISSFPGWFLARCRSAPASRTLGAWLSHADLYKHDDLPPDLLARAEDLSRLLATAEEIASGIRARVRHVTEPPEDQPSLGQVTADGISFIFKDVFFGRAPADYVVAMALSISRDLDISALEGHPAILKRQGFRNRLDQAYAEMLPFPIDSESVLLAGLHALATGEGAAMRYVHEQAKVALDEIDDVAMRELLSELPATAEQLIDEIDDPHGETDVALLSAALGVADNCPYCNATVVDPIGFSEAAIHHYGLSGDKADRVCERIREAVIGSGVDIGGATTPKLAHTVRLRSGKPAKQNTGFVPLAQLTSIPPRSHETRLNPRFAPDSQRHPVALWGYRHVATIAAPISHNLGQAFFFFIDERRTHIKHFI